MLWEEQSQSEKKKTIKVYWGSNNVHGRLEISKLTKDSN